MKLEDFIEQYDCENQLENRELQKLLLEAFRRIVALEKKLKRNEPDE